MKNEIDSQCSYLFIFIFYYLFLAELCPVLLLSSIIIWANIKTKQNKNQVPVLQSFNVGKSKLPRVDRQQFQNM